MQLKSKAIALSGIFGALALLVMLCGNLLPFAEYLCPALAGMLILPVVCEAGKRTGWLFYAGISVLSLLILPDKEPAFLFAALLGYYPLLRFTLEKLRPFVLRLLVKLAVFNTAVTLVYTLMLHLFGFEALQQEMAEMAGGALLLLLVLANITFLVYDLAVYRLFLAYRKLLRPRILKGLR